MTETFLSLVKNRTRKCRMQRESQTRHFVIKMEKLKEKEILEAEKEYQIAPNKGVLISLLDAFSTEIFQADNYWYKILKVIKQYDLQPRLLYSSKVSFIIEEEIKGFLGNLKKFSTNTKKETVLWEILKWLLYKKQKKKAGDIILKNKIAISQYLSIIPVNAQQGAYMS